jgi:hypothetical protein
VTKPQQVADALAPVHRQQQARAVRGEQGRIADAELLQGELERHRELGGEGRDAVDIVGPGAPDLSLPASRGASSTHVMVLLTPADYS